MSNPILYTMPGTCALAPNIAVAWLNAPVSIKTMAHGDQKKEEYLSINPKGKVPALPCERNALPAFHTFWP